MSEHAFRVVCVGESRSFPTGDPFLLQARDIATTVLILGSEPVSAFKSLRSDRQHLVLIELEQQCLGEITGERKGEEGSNIIGFSRFRLGSGAPSQLVELVVQPRTDEKAKAEAIALFEVAGFKTAICADRPGRIVNRLIRPYFNAALERLDDGLATADDLDRALKLGLGFKRGPIEWLEETGLADHARVSDELSQALSDPNYRPARRARVAAKKDQR
jgi:3-hydroxybutyryl-CoA dehydrogenase